MKVWMKIVASLASGALFCAAQTATPSSPPQPASVPAGGSESQPAPASSAGPKVVPEPESQPVPPPGPVPAQAANAAAPEAASQTVPVPPPTAKPGDSAKPAANLYVIGPLDVLYIRVWNNGNLTGIYDVQDDGTISVPLIGLVKADGLTVDDLRKLIATKLTEGDLVKNPEVTAQVTKSNSRWFYIMGPGAGHPGAIPLLRKLTISEALTSAGGFSPFANQKKIYLLRKSENYGQKHFFNYKDVMSGKHLEQDIVIEKDDRIVIPE